MLMFVTAKWAEVAALNAVIFYALFYGGVGQMVAGIFEMIKGNTFAATAFFSYGAFWCAWFALNAFAKTTQGPVTGATSFHVGETLIMCLWGVFTLCFFVPTLRKNICLMFM
eukprot:gene3363-3638_t